MKTLGKLKLKAEKMLSHEELVSFRGGSGSWDGRCGVKYQGSWSCGSGEGYSYENVTWAYNYDQDVTGWCCASCGNHC